MVVKPKEKEENSVELPAPPEMDEDLEREEDSEDQSLSALGAANVGDEDEQEVDDLFATFDPNEEEDGMTFDDPNLTHLDPSPSLGGRTGESVLFGNRAIGPMGRSTSPPLFAQVANFPTCHQLRVWVLENGIPCGLGVIAATSAEEDLIREFYHAMPGEGEGRKQFKLRPIDITGQEMGQEINLMISEHHSDLQRKRRMGYDEESEEDEISVTAASEMSRMFDRMMEASQQKSRALENALEDERSRLRVQEDSRAQERVDMATNAAQGVQVLTERMMVDESRRNESAVRMQQEQNQTMVTTLTSIFAQQQTMMQGSMEAARRGDEYRLEQERQRANREREDEIVRRERERREADERFRQTREEAEIKLRTEREYLERRLLREQKEMEFRLQREREEAERRSQRDREEREARERWLSEERSRRDQVERESSSERESERQRRHDRMVSEAQASTQRDREHAERMMTLSKIEMSNSAMGGLGELLPKATGFLKTMGVEPGDLVQRLLGPPEEESGTMELISSALGVAGEVAKGYIASKAPIPLASVQAPPRMLPSHPPSSPDSAAMEGAFAPSASSPGGSPSVQTTPATSAGLSLQDQKKARMTLRKLVQVLGVKPPAEWEEIMLRTFGAEPSIYEYIKAVTVRSALYEAGASDHMVIEILRGLKESTLVPADIPFGA